MTAIVVVNNSRCVRKKNAETASSVMRNGSLTVSHAHSDGLAGSG
jgi:hypothetical protein